MGCIPKILLLEWLLCCTWNVASMHGLEFVITHSRLPTPIRSHNALYDGDDYIYIVGGTNGTSQEQIIRHSLSSGSVDVIGRFQGMPLESGAAALHGEAITRLGGFLVTGGSPTTYVYRHSLTYGNNSEVGRLPTALANMGSAWDPRNNLTYTFGGGYNTARYDYVYRYNPNSNQVNLVSQIPGGGRAAPAAAWSEAGFGYIFGGTTSTAGAGRRDIHEFDFIQGTVVKLPTVLPYNLTDPCAVFAGEEAYVFGGSDGLMRFSPGSGQAEALDVEIWPRRLELAACVYVPKLARIYVIGGWGSFSGENVRYRDEISYVDLGRSDPPTTTTTPEPTEGTTEPPEFDCPSTGIDTYPHISNCSLFYICSEGKLSVDACAFPLYYDADPSLKICNYPDIAVCHSECPREGVHYVAIRTHACDYYKVCFQGQAANLRCADETVFNPLEQRCVRKDTYTCPYAAASALDEIFL